MRVAVCLAGWLSRVNGLHVNGDELLGKPISDELLSEAGGGKLSLVSYSNELMKTKNTQQLTVHLDDSDVRVIQMGSLLSITDDKGDTLHLFLSTQGWEQLREKLNQRALQAADS